MRTWWARGWVTIAGISAVSTALADPQSETVRRAPPLMLGGAVQPAKAPVLLDPVLPRGRLRQTGLSPLMKNTLCSLGRPVCVAGDERIGEPQATALAHLERAYEEIEFGSKLSSLRVTPHAPLVWVLAPRAPLGVEDEPVASRGFDRGRARCSGGALTMETARQCVLRAAVVRLAPATASWLRDGWSAETSRGLGDAPEATASVQSSFAEVHAGVLTSSVTAPTRDGQPGPWISPLRSARFFGYLDRRSRGGLGDAGFLSLVLASTQLSAGMSRWDAEPDMADVIATTLLGDRIAVARFYDDFAQDAFHDSRQRGFALEPDWEIDGATLPRSVAFPFPMEPTGSVYARLTLPEQIRDEVIGFRTSCEAPVSYVWSVARLDEDDHEISRFPLTYEQRGGSASGRVLPDEKARSLLAVGTNVGGVSLAHPFDPDHGPHEAHGCTITIDIVPAQGGAPQEQ